MWLWKRVFPAYLLDFCLGKHSPLPSEVRNTIFKWASTGHPIWSDILLTAPAEEQWLGQ